MYFTIGSDPEVLLTDGKRFVSAIGKLPGTKQNPYPTSFGAVHVDNVTAEINIHPATSSQEWEQNMLNALLGLEDMVQSEGLCTSNQSVGKYSDSDLEHPDAHEAGCDPDVNAYSQMWNCVPALQATKFRCAGGHIHIGTELTAGDMEQLAKVLDLMVSLPMLGVDHPMRRNLYGGAGAFRPKSYGMEYRTPSNNWIFSQSTRQWVFKQVDRALHEFKRVCVPNRVEDIINMHNTEEIAYFMAEFELVKYPNVSGNIMKGACNEKS